MRSADITFVILTKNEAANIAGCLGSLPAQSPAFVYDAQSQDTTVALARSLGAQIAVAPWQGYVQARLSAAGLVNTTWTFMLDADERVTPELAAELARLEPPADVAGYSVPRRNWFCGRWIRRAGWWPDRLVRLFRSGKATLKARGSDPSLGVHETWVPVGRCEELRAPLDHFSYASVSEYRRKFALYTNLEAKTTSASLAGVIGAWLIVPLRSVWLLLRRGGILDGWRGFYVCAGSAVYPAVVVTKSWLRPRSAS